MIIVEGREWHVRGLVKAAKAEADRYRELGANGARRATYCDGVADVLTALVENVDQDEMTSMLSGIFRKFSDDLA